MKEKKFDKVKYIAEYTSTHYVKFTYRVRTDDTEILDKLKSVDSVNGYITELIRKDIENGK